MLALIQRGAELLKESSPYISCQIDHAILRAIACRVLSSPVSGTPRLSQNRLQLSELNKALEELCQTRPITFSWLTSPFPA